MRKILFAFLLLALLGAGCNSASSALLSNPKTLSRESAAKMIKEHLQKFPLDAPGAQSIINPLVQSYSFNEHCFVGVEKREKVKALEAAGYVKIVGEQYGIVYFDFTELAKPYIQKSNLDAGMNALKEKIVSVEVTGITEGEPNQKAVSYIAKYEPTPIGKILDEKQGGVEAKGQLPFTLYDDGWRVGN